MIPRPFPTLMRLAFLALALGGCGARRESSLTLKGSDTMVILGQRWAETFMAAHPGRVIQVTGGGSGTGIAALINGTTDICQASRPMSEEERAQVRAKGGELHEIVVAKDGIALYVHDANPVHELTLAQIRDLYTGKIERWSEVSGTGAPVTLYGRENSSGTYVYFKEHVLEKADFAARVQTLPGTAAVVNAVAQDPSGIGYGGAAYAQGVAEVAVKANGDSPGVRPSEATVRDGSYPISRDLYFYMRQAPAGAAREFVDWVLSAPGQAIVTQVGYYPVR